MVIFGPSGCGDEFIEDGHKGILEVPQWLKNKGLDAYEYSFGHGYQMSTDKARQAGEVFKDFDIKLSLHAPFYINFANPSDEMYQKTQGYIYTGINFLRAFNADRLIFHPASCGKQTREEAIKLTTERFKDTFDKMESEGLLDGLLMCPETMGKTMQIGTYKEIVDLCTLHEKLIPTLDFGHINCILQGKLDLAEYRKILDYMFEKLGDEKAKMVHIHFSKNTTYALKTHLHHNTSAPNPHTFLSLPLSTSDFPLFVDAYPH